MERRFLQEGLQRSMNKHMAGLLLISILFGCGSVPITANLENKHTELDQEDDHSAFIAVEFPDKLSQGTATILDSGELCTVGHVLEIPEHGQYDGEITVISTEIGPFDEPSKFKIEGERFETVEGTHVTIGKFKDTIECAVLTKHERTSLMKPGLPVDSVAHYTHGTIFQGYTTSDRKKRKPVLLINPSTNGQTVSLEPAEKCNGTREGGSGGAITAVFDENGNPFNQEKIIGLVTAISSRDENGKLCMLGTHVIPFPDGYGQ